MVWILNRLLKKDIVFKDIVFVSINDANLENLVISESVIEFLKSLMYLNINRLQ
jgi:uncharacterized protein YpiB (UPF0302 family)